MFDFIVGGLLIAIVTWVVVSYCNIVKPDEVALRYWAGGLERSLFTSRNGLFGTGLQFVPWLPGIKLIRISKKMQKHLFEKDQDPKVLGNVMSGTMLAVRSKDWQKMFVEASVFNRFPYDDVDSLILLIEAGVPIGDTEQLREYIEDEMTPDLNAVFGLYHYKEVMGGLKNEELNEKINERLQQAGSQFFRVGFFGKDAKTKHAGTGEFDLKIEFVHLSGKLSEKLELVETTRLEAIAQRKAAKIKVGTAKLEAEAKKEAALVGVETARFEAEAVRVAAKLGEQTAKSVAVRDAEETHGRVFLMVAHAAGLTPEALAKRLEGGEGQKLRGKPASEGGYMEAFAQAYDQVRRDRAGEQGELNDFRFGNTDGTPFQEGAVLGMIAAAAGWLGGGNESGKGKKPKPGNGGKKKGANSGKATDPADDPADDFDDLEDLSNLDDTEKKA